MMGANVNQTWHYSPQKIERRQFKTQAPELLDLRRFKRLVSLTYTHRNSLVSFSVSCLYTSGCVSILMIQD